MKTHLTALALACAFACPAAHAGFFDAALQTLPGGYSSSGEGFFAQQKNGLLSLIDNGSTGVVLPLYTNHPSWDYDNRHEENGYPYGAGIMRSVLDDRGNERMAFALAFSDSHYSPEPTFGYSWIARHNVSDKFHVGAGYILGITLREDYKWLPIPVPLPVVKAGTDTVGLYMTFIPVSNVFFFFSSIATDKKDSQMYPIAGDSAFANRTEIYGAALHVKTDSATEHGFTVSSDAGKLLGVRHFVTDQWAVDATWSRSEHETFAYGIKDREWKMDSYTASAQYHMRFNDSVRLHAGAGVGYSKLEQKNGPLSSSAVYPVIQSGVTWAPTAHTRVLGGINLLFPRFDDVAPAGDVVFQPSPVQFYIGAGFAF